MRRAFPILILLPAMSAACKKTIDGGSTPAEFPRWPIRASDRADCKVNRTDPFEPGAAFSKGHYRGKCIDMRWFRPVFRMNAADAARWDFSADADHAVFANIADIDGSWYVARVPVTRIQGLTYLVERFNAGGVSAAHGMMRVTFAEPVLLRPQFPHDPGRTLSVNDLVLSVHAGTPADAAFDMLQRGTDSSYAVLWGVFTLRNKLKDSILRQGNSIEQLQLRLTPQDQHKVFDKYVQLSQAYSYTRTYHTAMRNCHSEQLHNLARAIGVREPRGEALGMNILRVLAAAAFQGMNRTQADITADRAHAALRERNLLDETTSLPELAQDPTVQEALTELR